MKFSNRYRWAFCQLEVLRHCLPPSIRHTLDELPESLDETYERILKEIKKPNRDHARRLLQCLVVAIRPLRVEELAEVLAVDFDDVEGVPKLNPNWRWEDEEQALLTSCSSLIAIAEENDSRVVRFSHFSVKEFLISTRLATSSRDLSCYHIDLEPAHTILAQACMGVLLQPENRVEDISVGRSSLAKYAAQHWVTHAQFKGVSDSLRKAMECLFDPDKPYFAAWLELYNIDIEPRKGDSSMYLMALHWASSASPLYYAALCGFQGLVEHLVVKSLQDVNASGGCYMRPLVAALARRHFQTAEFLRHNGAHANVHGIGNLTPLHSAAWCGDLETVQTLINYEADVNDTQNTSGESPMHSVSSGSGSKPLPAVHNVTQSWPDVARLLLEHSVDVNGRDREGRTPLQAAARSGNVEVMRVLLEYGANIGAEDQTGRGPLHEAVKYGNVKVMRVLLGHGANTGAEDKTGRTLIHEVAKSWDVVVTRVLLEHGANMCAEDKTGRTPLHEAVEHRKARIINALLERAAAVGAEDKTGKTPLHEVMEHTNVEIMRVLLEHGANIDAEDKTGRTLLHEAAKHGSEGFTRVLLEHGANMGAEDKAGRTPLHEAAKHGSEGFTRVLLEHGANINAEDDRGRSPLHEAAEHGHGGVIDVLLEHGADVCAEDKTGRTPIHEVAKSWDLGFTHVLLEYGANINAEDDRGRSPLHEALEHGNLRVMRVLLEYGADVGAKDKNGKTPFQIASSKRYSRIVELLSYYSTESMFSISTSSLCLPL